MFGLFHRMLGIHSHGNLPTYLLDCQTDQLDRFPRMINLARVSPAMLVGGTFLHYLMTGRNLPPRPEGETRSSPLKEGNFLL